MFKEFIAENKSKALYYRDRHRLIALMTFKARTFLDQAMYWLGNEESIKRQMKSLNIKPDEFVEVRKKLIEVMMLLDELQKKYKNDSEDAQ